MDDATVVRPVDGKLWISPLCKLLVEGCTALADYRVFVRHNGPVECVGHNACEEHAQAAREGRTREPATRVESLRASERKRDLDISSMEFHYE